LGPRQTDLSENPAQRYLRLLVNVAKKCRGRELPFGALSQEGNAGLVRAVDQFDSECSLRFSTYATWWICQRGLRDRGRAIHLPLHEGETESSRLTPPARRSPPNSDATPAPESLQDVSARG
jgi:RNA polymerase sigma factor (sigma-70 family)